MKKFAFFLCLCFLVLPSAGSAQDSPKCSIEAVKAVLTRPNRVQFEVKYNIPPGHPKPCFIGAYVPSRASRGPFSYTPAGRNPEGIPKGQRGFSDDVFFEITYEGAQSYNSSTMDVIIYDRDETLCSLHVNWGQLWLPKSDPNRQSGVKLESSLIVRTTDEAERLDQDRDGLIDGMESALAHAIRPYYIFDTSENARQPFEPVTLFQVRPLDLSDMMNLRVKILWVFLFRNDGSYGPDSYCGDAHGGDNDSSFYELLSRDGGVTWDLAKVGVGKGGLYWGLGRDNIEVYGRHPVIFASAHKHHQYLDTSYNHRDSYYSEWWCNDDVNGRGVNVLVDLMSVAGAIFYNNVGEPEANPSPPFINDLSRFYSGHSAWGNKDFYSETCGPTAKKWMRHSFNKRTLDLFSFRSHNYPSHHIRHRNFLGEITTLASASDRQDATFKIVPGLSDGRNISFESVNYPGFYLRHQDFRLKLQRATGEELFKKDATFKKAPGLADAKGVSFESVNFPGRFIRHRDFHLYLESGSGDLFKKDATFEIIDPRY